MSCLQYYIKALPNSRLLLILLLQLQCFRFACFVCLSVHAYKLGSEIKYIVQSKIVAKTVVFYYRIQRGFIEVAPLFVRCIYWDIMICKNSINIKGLRYGAVIREVYPVLLVKSWWIALQITCKMFSSRGILNFSLLIFCFESNCYLLYPTHLLSHS